jgi:VanZ family protein
VRKFGLWVKYWGPVILWMSLIFGASGEHGSFRQSSRIIAPLLHWLFPGLSDDFIYGVVLAVRKCAHLSEYGILVLLVWRALRKPVRGDTRPWQWSDAAEALWFAVVYATTDEFHQTFIPSREGCLRDVCIDTAGAMTALVLFWCLGRWRNWWRPLRAKTPV